jgi:hypothetical protein
MRLAPTAHRRGAPPTQERTLAELYAELRARDGARVIQLNHPMDKLGGVRDDEAYLTHIGLDGLVADPELPLEEAPNDALLATARDGHTRAIDFDAIELMNGDSRGIYLAVRKQWHAFLRQGLRRTATANSDTHGPGQVAAYPHNYVYIGTKDEDRSDASFDAAIRAGRLFGTNGPLIAAFRVNGARMGDEVGTQDGRVDVVLAITAAPWVPVEEVRLLVNGDVVQSWRDLPQGPAPPVLRLEQRVALPITKDSFVTLEAGAPLEADPATWAVEHPGAYADVVAPGFVPTAFTNPIWVDADGDGRIAAAGLPPKPIQRARIFGGGGALLAAVAGGVFWRRRRKSG